MPTLPWTPSEAHPELPEEVLVFGSRLELKSYLAVPGFLSAAMKVRKQVLSSAGAVGVSLIAQPTRKTFWTLSAWVDQVALDAFVSASPHREVMAKYGPQLSNPVFRSFEVRPPSIPEAKSKAEALWAEARARIAAPN
jgi:heme-degrading monooxygenase HmoA